MNKELIENIKLNEDAGFKSGGKVYVDTEGFETIGYGTKLPLTQEECELLLRHRLNKVLSEVNSNFYDLEAPEEVCNILYEMAYQLGLGGLLKFKNMIKALYNRDYKTASLEMKDSLWYFQTPNRVEKLSKKMAEAN